MAEIICAVGIKKKHGKSSEIICCVSLARRFCSRVNKRQAGGSLYITELALAMEQLMKLASASPFQVSAPLRCSFPAELHPDYLWVRGQCDDWIVAVAQPPSDSARQFLLDCLLPRFGCRIFPSAHTARLVLATKILSWLFLSDTEDDNPQGLGADPAASVQRHELIMAVLRRGGLYVPTTTSAVQLKALAEVWEKVFPDMPPALRDRFTESMAQYLDAVRLQASYRSSDCLPTDVDGYVSIRRPASFCLPGFALMEYVLGIELDNDTYHDALIVQLHNAIIDHICFCNDLLSCHIEIDAGDFFNLPSVLYFSTSASCPTFTMQQAVDRAVEMVESADATCVDLVARILSTSLADRPGVRTYIKGLCSCMSGSLHWTCESARYRNPRS